MAKAELTLILPGLAAILEQKINSSIIPTYLTKIISKSNFSQDPSGLSRLLFNHFSANPITGSDLPIVSLEFEGDSYLRADPCYLHADRDRLLLFSDMMDLTNDESSALIAEIQPLFTDFDGILSQSSTDGWLLQLNNMPEVTFSALPEVSGKGVESYLPKGRERQDWIRLWSEVQMAMYASEVNQRRIENNKLPINSVWFWGAGEFEFKESPWKKIQGESTLLKQLAAKSEIPLQSDSDFSTETLSAGRYLWLADEINIDGDWLKQMQAFDDAVLRPLWQYCRQAKIAKIELQIPNHGCYQLTPLDCWKFWKS